MHVLELKQRWLSLYPPQDADVMEDIFASLCTKYGERHRHYHTLEHIASCLALLDTIKDKIAAPVTLEIALWFHDVIYEPRKKNNELLSARYAKHALIKTGLDPETVTDIGQLIMATKHPCVATNDDEKFMIDIDLSILGAAAPDYATYAGQIRDEYAHIPDILYSVGRKKVLKSFLKAAAIYQTDYFFQKYEAAARSNLLAEIKRL